MTTNLTGKDKQRLKKLIGERLLPTGQIQEASLTLYDTQLGEEKKSAVNATRKSFVDILVENFKRLNQAVDS